MLTFAADKRCFKLRHGINMAPTTCDRVNQMRRLEKSRKGEKRQLAHTTKLSALTSEFRGSNVKCLGLLFLSQPPVLSFQEANDHDRDEHENGAKDPSKDDCRLARAVLIPRPNNRGCWNWPSAVWSCLQSLISNIFAAIFNF